MSDRASPLQPPSAPASPPRAERRGLGRGLSALMAEAGFDVLADPTVPPPPPDRSLPINALRPNPIQPRRSFSEASLEELAKSIREKGIIQPLIVRPAPDAPETYEIVAGERRWRAAARAGLTEVPVIIRAFDDTEVLEIGIIENIQREDINHIDETAAYKTLIERFGRTQERIADALGKSRSHVANTIRLLNLPPLVQAMVIDGRLTAGHARALLGAPNPEALARKVLARGLNVRQTEALVRQMQTERGQTRSKSKADDPDTRAVEELLTAALGMPVTITHREEGGGKVTIRYRNLDELDGLCALIQAAVK